MNKNQKGIIGVSGVELAPGEPTVCLGSGSMALSVVATSATTICFVFLNLIQKTKKKILMRKKFIFDDRIKRTRSFNNSSSFSCR